MRMLRAVRSVAILPCLVGCHQTLLVTPPRSLAPADTQQVSWSHHFLYGFIGRRQLDLRDYCPQSTVERVELSSNTATVALTFATLGIYWPRRVTITCTPKGSW